MPLSAPSSVSTTHEHLLQLLVGAQQLGGKTGQVAEEVAKLVKPHIEKEEEIFLPLLGILPEAAGGKMSLASAKRAAKMYSKAMEEYRPMIEEHKKLDKVLARLKRVADEEGHPTATRFAELLKEHSLGEDQILYPAAILAGQIAQRKAKTT